MQRVLRSTGAGLLLGLVGALSAPSCGADDCRVCQHEKCSDVVSVCNEDPDCSCMAACVADAGLPGVDGCLDGCGLTARPPGFPAVEECMTLTCPDDDECSAAGPYVPPDPDDSAGMSTMEDIGAGDLPDCSFDPTLAFDPEGEVLQLQSADATVCMRIDRRNEGPGSLANTQWTLLDVRVGPLGEVVHVDDAAALCWYSSHHNFTDWAHTWAGTRHYDLKLVEDGHGGARTYELLVYEQGPLDPASCSPVADGSLRIGEPIALLPVEP